MWRPYYQYPGTVGLWSQHDLHSSDRNSDVYASGMRMSESWITTHWYSLLITQFRINRAPLENSWTNILERNASRWTVQQSKRHMNLLGIYKAPAAPTISPSETSCDNNQSQTSNIYYEAMYDLIFLPLLHRCYQSSNGKTFGGDPCKFSSVLHFMAYHLYTNVCHKVSGNSIGIWQANTRDFWVCNLGSSPFGGYTPRYNIW